MTHPSENPNTTEQAAAVKRIIDRNTPTDDEREVARTFAEAVGWRWDALESVWQEAFIGAARKIAGFHRTGVPEPSAETIAKLRTWIAGEPFEASQARTGQPVAKVPEPQQQGYVNGYSAAVEHVAAILDAGPQGKPSDTAIRNHGGWDMSLQTKPAGSQGEPSDAQVVAALKAVERQVNWDDPAILRANPGWVKTMRAALRAAGGVR